MQRIVNVKQPAAMVGALLLGVVLWSGAPGAQAAASGQTNGSAGQPAAAPAPPTAEQAQPFLGEWTATVDAPPGPVTFLITIKVTDGKVVGTVGNDMMGNNTASEITIEGKVLTLRYTADMMGNPAPVVLVLTPENDKLKTDFSLMNGQFQLTGFATKRARSSKVPADLSDVTTSPRLKF